MRCANVGRLRLHHHRVATESGAHLVTHFGVGPITADQVGGRDLADPAGLEILSDRPHAGLTLPEINDSRAAQDAKSRCRCSVREQYGFQVNLVDSMRRLGCRPPGVGPALRRVALGATRNRDARKLDPCRGGAEGNVVRIIGGQTRLAHRPNQAETTKNLHCARGNVVAFHAGRLAGAARFGDRHLDPALREIHRQRQPNGSPPTISTSVLIRLPMEHCSAATILVTQLVYLLVISPHCSNGSK